MILHKEYFIRTFLNSFGSYGVDLASLVTPNTYTRLVDALAERLVTSGELANTVSLKPEPDIALLRDEVSRLRSGQGGHGGGSPRALALADAIERLLRHP